MSLSIHRRHLMLGAAALAVMPGLARAQAWPARPVKVLVGFPAGQATDIIARTFSDELSKDLKQSFVVENRPGAGSMLSAQQLKGAAADG